MTEQIETPQRTTAPGPDAPTAVVDARGDRPRLARGVELLGRFEGSGYKEPPFMARRADGQMVQLPPLLYLVAERLDGNRTYDRIAREVSDAARRGLDPGDARMLVEEKLHPLGVAAGPDGADPEVQKADAFLALKMKKALVPPRVVRAVTAIFRPLFWPPVVLAVLVGLVAFDAWFFFAHGVAESARQLLYQPLYLIMTFAFVVLAAALHETGHATGCRYGGAEPGAMGAGIYLVWPAFYTDVTESYRLGKGGRLRTDLGGVYFNAIFILAVGGAYFATGIEALLIPVLIAHLEMFRQLLPLLRLDGYHVLADLTGVPDLFARIKPILVSVIPGKRADKRVTQLKPWVRVVVTLWVLVFVPFILLNVAYILIFAPRIFATGWDSFLTHLRDTGAAFDRGAAGAGAAGVLQLVALSLPALGIAYGLSRSSVRTVRGLWGRTDGRPFSRLVGFLLLGGAVGAVAAFWWPDGDYRAIRPGERWTVQDAAVAASATASGAPAFSDDDSPNSPRDGDGDGTPVTTEREGESDLDATPSPSPDVSVTPATSPSAAELSPTPSAETSPSAEPTTQPTPTTEVSP